MFNIAVLISKDFMAEQTKKVAKIKNIDLFMIKVVETSNIVNEARQAVENGADIIVARGVQATFIKQYTNIPIAEIIITGQELGLLISRAKKIIKIDKPKIAIIGFENMFGDTSYYDEIHDISLQMYLSQSFEKINENTVQAIRDGADILIGGDTVREIAKEYNIPFVFMESTEESISKALDTAKRMEYTAQIERNKNAEFDTIIDTSLQALIKIDTEKNITAINKVAEELFTKNNKNLKGKNISEVILELKNEYIDLILKDKRDIFNTSIVISNTPFMITIVPIKDNNLIFGAIINCYKLSITQKENKSEINTFLRGYSTKNNFESISISKLGKEMKYCIEMAKMYALSQQPILIYGEVGTEKEFFAGAIHNNSLFKTGPFISVNCAGMTERKQIEMLFGDINSVDKSIKKGALELSEKGTVLIHEIDKLSQVCQYRLFRSIKYKSLVQNDLEENKILDNRVIVTSTKRLDFAVQNGEFREDLFYLLNALVLDLPAMRERKSDIKIIVEKRLADFIDSYSKFIKISDDAMKLIEEYEWLGNAVQLEAFCERMFLSTPKKIISENYVQFLLDELYPKIEIDNNEKKMVVYKHLEAEKISNLLEKFHGNRQLVAKELHISTTTLWRRMKKYGILDKEDF